MWPLNHEIPRRWTAGTWEYRPGPLEKGKSSTPSPFIFRFDVSLPGVKKKKHQERGTKPKQLFFFPQHLLEKTCSSRDRLLDHLKAKQRSDCSPWQPRKRRTEDLGWLVDWCLLVTLLFFYDGGVLVVLTGYKRHDFAALTFVWQMIWPMGFTSLNWKGVFWWLHFRFSIPWE